MDITGRLAEWEGAGDLLQWFNNELEIPKLGYKTLLQIMKEKTKL
jgi:hypothetical protein